ncbi:MAG: hypothetical protein A2X08_17850 [Bacteroidetes bacterium GWA2_32_17]|nr:MAG: hypothetical protein A2X08_17850 [Bacteroidetes bacterium GWA2_32_17]
MKKSKLFILITIIAFSFSCKKDSKITDIINPSASMKCKIDGVDWTAQIRETNLQSNKFIIIGTTGSSVLNVTIIGITTGTYIIDPLAAQVQASATYTNSTSTDSLYTAYEGSVTLSSVDTTNKKINGTYSFKAKNLLHPLLNDKNITGGSFTELSY